MMADIAVHSGIRHRFGLLGTNQSSSERSESSNRQFGSLRHEATRKPVHEGLHWDGAWEVGRERSKTNI